MNLTINSQVTGDGDIAFTGSDVRNYSFIYNGDMSYFYGDFYNGTKDGEVITEFDNRGFNLTFNGTQTADAAPTWATSASGYGAIDLGNRNLTYNFTTAGATPGVALINNSMVDVQNATFNGTAAYKVTSAFTADLLTLSNANTTTFTGSSLALTSAQIGAGATLSLGDDAGTSFAEGLSIGSLDMQADSTLHVNNATLNLASLQATGAATVSTAAGTTVS